MGGLSTFIGNKVSWKSCCVTSCFYEIFLISSVPQSFIFYSWSFQQQRRTCQCGSSNRGNSGGKLDSGARGRQGLGSSGDAYPQTPCWLHSMHYLPK